VTVGLVCLQTVQSMTMVPRPEDGGPMVIDERQAREDLRRLAMSGATDQVALLIKASPSQADEALDAEGNRALHFAARGGHLRLTQELVTMKCDVDNRDSKMRSPLHVACMENHEEIAMELLVATSDPNAMDGFRQTPLHHAARGHRIEVLQVLIDHGKADPSIADSTKTSPLLLSAELGKHEFIAFILSRFPELVSSSNEHGWTALHLAAHGKEMRKDPTKPAKFATSVRMLLSAQADVNATDEDTKTPLHRAAQTGNAESVRSLIDGGSDVMASDHCRWMPLHYACQDGHLDVASILLNAKAAVERENPPCLTPLAVATMENQVKIAELLMKHKADPNLRGKGLASPMMIARKEKEKHEEILSLFELGFIAHAD